MWVVRWESNGCAEAAPMFLVLLSFDADVIFIS